MTARTLSQARRRRGRTLTGRGIFRWFFVNRKTGEITIAQAPNLALWIVIGSGVLLWIWPNAGNANLALKIAFNGCLLGWAVDEIVRGVNPWRRCFGTAVLVFKLATILG